MTTATDNAIRLSDDEVEIMRGAAFDAMETHKYAPTRPRLDAKIQDVIQSTVAMTNYFRFYVEVLRAAEAAAIGPRLRSDPEFVLLTALLGAWEQRLIEWAQEYRDSLVDDPEPIEAQLDVCRALLIRLRATGGGA